MSAPPSTSHPERTVSQPRQSGLHNATISHIRSINSRIRLIRLGLPYAIRFLPGQWLDLHIPSLPTHTGGFTITSPPSLASLQPFPTLSPLSRSFSPSSAASKPSQASKPPYIELAIQDSPSNPPAAWLWKPKREILGEEVKIRVGGSFVWPPWKAKGGDKIGEGGSKRAVFVAGGVGINPLMSILSHISSCQESSSIPKTIRLLYSTRLPSSAPPTTESPSSCALNDVLFFPRLHRIFSDRNHPSQPRGDWIFELFLSSPFHSTSAPELDDANSGVFLRGGRIKKQDLRKALGPAEDREETVVYVCGPQLMTDEVVAFLEEEEGMEGRVLVEKWW
ncbi:hypothetical protein MMC10_009470 [Thelotrema lepadinum]|nr:hypothetical protein [Thelotrema lepadinum]